MNYTYSKRWALQSAYMYAGFRSENVMGTGTIGDPDVIFKMDLPEVRCDVRPELNLLTIDSDGLFL